MPKNSQITDFFKRRAQPPPESPRSPDSQLESSPTGPEAQGPAPYLSAALNAPGLFGRSSPSAPGPGDMLTGQPRPPLPTSSSLSSLPSSNLSSHSTYRVPSFRRNPPSPAQHGRLGSHSRTPSSGGSVPPHQDHSSPVPLPSWQSRNTGSGFLADLPSSPPTPLHIEPAEDNPVPIHARSRLDEIKGSDEEDSDESDDLPDLFAIPAAKDVPIPAAKDTKPWETPKAKRRAVLSFDSSPLVPKHPKLDMKKLVAQARQYEKNDAIVAGIEELQGANDKEGSRDGSPEDMEGMLLDQDDSGKLLQAVKRTGAAARMHWHFFTVKDEGGFVATTAFPKHAAQGKWAFLSAAETRSDHFVSGLAHSKQARHRNLPDEILLWILDEITSEKRHVLRSQYLELIRACESEQLRSTLTEQRISQLFLKLGALEEAVDPNLALTILSTRQDNPSGTIYDRKDWANLCSVLGLIASVSDKLSDKARERTIHILLRLGIDNIVHDDVAIGVCFREAMRKATNAVPDSIWDDLCPKLASSLYVKVDDASLRWEAIFACLDGGSTRLHQLQRTLALASCGITDLNHIELDMVEVFSRLDDPEFVIRPETDYFDLAALAATLALAIGDGDKPDVIVGNPGVAQRDTNIDAVAQKLKEIESRIHFSTMNNTVPRMASKSQLGNLQMILTRITRSREPPELGIMASPEAIARRDIPKQRNFMQKFLEKGKLRSATATDDSDDTSKGAQTDGTRVVRFSLDRREHTAAENVAEALAQQIERETASAEEKARARSPLARLGVLDTDMDQPPGQNTDA
ncbi:hypothetical protein GQ53DRAFT_849131 [Thozetella sp. PMI_491]|nr:hypothetical protein GQ53DRAFT_849131 [Thozetella sp. PMI_491]